MSAGVASAPAMEAVVRDFCHEQGLADDLLLTPLRAGRNSQVFRVEAAQHAWIVKRYVAPPPGGRDRLACEFNFLRFCNAHSLAGVPHAMAVDESRYMALYSCLPGERPRHLTAHHIAQAVSFLLRLNALRGEPAAKALPTAADACLQWQDHLDLLARRLDRLQRVAEPAAGFVQQSLLPAWQVLQPTLAGAMESVAPILSPSDFGFHNCLEAGGHCAFVDFEYAGWDDPAKLICDFLCQPEVPVSDTLGEQFLQAFCEGLAGDGDTLRLRVRRLLPLHRLKWCCIMLNEFCADDWQRRLHAGLVAEDLLETQFRKAHTYFERYVAPGFPAAIRPLP